MRVVLASACLAVIGLTLTACASSAPAAPDVTAAPVAQSLQITRAPGAVSALPGWSVGRHDASLSAYRATCPRLERLDDAAPVGPPYAGAAGPWKRACADARAVPDGDPSAARAFFEERFVPVALASEEGADGLTTAYYEPEIEARRTSEPPFTEPLVKRPENLVVLEAPAYGTYARGAREEVFLRRPSGVLGLAPARGAIRRDAQPGDIIAYGRLSDVVFLQIQGSGRLRFPDGARLRAAYAANNGRPYSSIARTMADEGVLTIDQASNDRMKAWLNAASPAEADRIVNQNQRYVYFQAEPLPPNPSGPRGAANVPLTAHASIAIDPDWHAFGLLYWVAPEGEGAPAARLGVSQDTGGAIVGPLRADLYFGSGETAGDAAARVRHRAQWWAVVPAAVGAELAEGQSP